MSTPSVLDPATRPASAMAQIDPAPPAELVDPVSASPLEPFANPDAAPARATSPAWSSPKSKSVAAITERELRADTSDELRALAALLAARGFACMAGGQLIIFVAANDDMIDAKFKSEPRSLGNTLHGLEYLEKARWGRWRRYGPRLRARPPRWLKSIRLRPPSS